MQIELKYISNSFVDICQTRKLCTDYLYAKYV